MYKLYGLSHAALMLTHPATVMSSTATYHPFEGGSVPRNRKKPAPARWLSPARFCIAVCVLVTAVIATSIAYAAWVAASAFWQGYSVPHLDKHAAPEAHHPIPPRDGNVVRSFFGPKEAGGVDVFDLKAALWTRVHNPDGNGTGEFPNSQT